MADLSGLEDNTERWVLSRQIAEIGARGYVPEGCPVPKMPWPSGSGVRVHVPEASDASFVGPDHSTRDRP